MNNKPLEEYLAWPPLTSAMGILIGITCFGVFSQYHQLISSQSGYIFAGFIFPVVMALAFAWRLHGKYWLGFAWLGIVFYLLAWITSLFSPSHGTGAELLMGFCALAILFAVQSAALFLKRKFIQAENSHA